MATATSLFFILISFLSFQLLAFATISNSSADLSPNYYQDSCPTAVEIIKAIVAEVVHQQPRMGASLLRLHFHDCFVNGCDGSILLDGTNSEKDATPNKNSVRGFDVVERIKARMEHTCPGVISCADILAIAATESVSLLGGPKSEILLGRRDSSTANFSGAMADLPGPSSNLETLISKFQVKGLSLNDLVALSGAHTIGFARCTTFRSRIYNDTNINKEFAESLHSVCPTRGGDDNLTTLDDQPSAAKFDNSYFMKLTEEKGLLHSDQELFHGGVADDLVLTFKNNVSAFAEAFASAMQKMGNISPLTGKSGLIRNKCNEGVEQ